LFAAQPIHHQADLLSRFEVVGPDPAPRPAPGSVPDDGSAPVTVRPRDQPNRWYALRRIPLDSDLDGDGNDDATGAATRAHEGTVFVLRDVTDSRDFQPERAAFLSVLSHELRTPITTIYAGSSVLARRPSLAPPASQILARDISAEAARLYDLVEDLLVLARLERQVLDLSDEPVFLQRAVHATIRMALDRQPEASIRRTGVATPPPVHGDATYVEQACRNLVLTSLRFAGPEPDRALVVDLRVDTDAGEVAMAVLDRGPAVAPDELDRAFELPDPAATDRLAGAGIGPFVCRHLVEAMGGRVWARNREDGGGGVELGFSLPVDERG
jgi:K+-sensing histidine kinase KdpD